MKKLLLTVLLLLLVFPLVSCGGDNSETTATTEAVEEVEDAIRAIGRVSINSKESIEKAQELYNALTDSEKGQVRNFREFNNARYDYEYLRISFAKAALEKIDQACDMYEENPNDISNVKKLLLQAEGYILTVEEMYCEYTGKEDFNDLKAYHSNVFSEVCSIETTPPDKDSIEHAAGAVLTSVGGIAAMHEVISASPL